MKILHFSDTHLWFQIDNSSREEDFYNSFTKVINYALENNISYVIHSWDLFHYSKPSNKALSICIEWLLKLSKKWIKIIMLAWNHSTPRLTTTTHPFKVFDKIDNVYTISENHTKKIDFEDVRFTGLPHIHDEKLFNEELSKAWEFLSKDKLNIYISHFWISAQDYDEYTDEISWINIKKEDLANLKKYDYVAMWHYHKNFKIWNIHYSWSLEHTSFNQKWNKTWFNVLTVESWEITDIEFVQNTSRDMIEYEFDCVWIRTTEELLSALNEKEFETKDKIVKFNFINMWTHLLLEFKDSEVWEYFKEAFYFEYRKFKKETDENKKVDFKQTDNFIKDAFSDFWDSLEIDENLDKEKIKEELISKIK